MNLALWECWLLLFKKAKGRPRAAQLTAGGSESDVLLGERGST